MNYGATLRTIRKKMNLTLDEVSKRTDFTKSFISQIENGKNSPSIVSLQKICSALNITIGELFQNEKPNIYILKEQDFQNDSIGKSKFSYMSTKFSGRKLEPIIIEIQPNGEMNSKNCKITSEKFAFIIQGNAKVLIDNEEHFLNEKELIYFSFNTSYKIVNTSNEVLKILCVGINSLY